MDLQSMLSTMNENNGDNWLTALSVFVARARISQIKFEIARKGQDGSIANKRWKREDRKERRKKEVRERERESNSRWICQSREHQQEMGRIPCLNRGTSYPVRRAALRSMNKCDCSLDTLIPGIGCNLYHLLPPQVFPSPLHPSAGLPVSVRL